MSTFCVRLTVVSFAVGLLLAGCASAPKPGASPVGRGMAPIPNPEARGVATSPSPKPRLAAPKAKAATARIARPDLPPAPRRATDSARATQLRARGLEQLNRGDVKRAVALLSQARQLDPDNALIQRDLDRAIRIGRVVAAQP